MEIIKPQFEIWEQQPGEQGIYEQIERCGRVCYKSEGHKTADSARPFVERMIKSQHTAMLEHGTVYLTLPMAKADGEPGCVYNKVAIDAGNAFSRNPFSHVNMDENAYYVTTNLRVLVENDWMALLSYLTEPTALHDRRVTVHFTTQVAITREFNRHRANSIAEQSTRYCNYSKDKLADRSVSTCPHGWPHRRPTTPLAYHIPARPTTSWPLPPKWLTDRPTIWKTGSSPTWQPNVPI